MRSRRCWRRFLNPRSWTGSEKDSTGCRIRKRAPRLTGRDWFGALCVCILVILSTFPVVVPFVVFENAQTALRVSNVIAVVSLFFCGVIFARHAGLRPWSTGFIMVVVGVALVGIAIALGG
jgi:VIT1/CCC1 family predicted Fe2+/Mn2+ transporter